MSLFTNENDEVREVPSPTEGPGAEPLSCPRALQLTPGCEPPFVLSDPRAHKDLFITTSFPRPFYSLLFFETEAPHQTGEKKPAL